MREKRTNFIFGFVGVNKTGKTSTAVDIAKRWKQKNPNGRVWGYDWQKVFVDSDKKIIDKYLDVDSDDWGNDCCQLRNGLLILDELKLLLPYPQHTPKSVTKLLNNCFYWNIDIIYCVHNPSVIPEVFSFFTTHLFIFLTFAKEGGFNKKTPNSFLSNEAAKKVSDYVSLHGRGKHIKDPLYKGEGFPHAVVSNEEQKIFYVNMNKK